QQRFPARTRRCREGESRGRPAVSDRAVARIEEAGGDGESGEGIGTAESSADDLRGSREPPGRSLMRVHRQPSGAGERPAPTTELGVLLLAVLLLFQHAARAREQFTRLKSDEQ